MKQARIKLQGKTVEIYLSQKEAEKVSAYIQEWTTFLTSSYPLFGVKVGGFMNEVYTNDEILTGLTKVLEGLGYEVRS